MRLNWFSPLPPERTDIAHYTARIAAALMRKFEVVFWSDLTVDPTALPPGAVVQAFDAAQLEGRDLNRALFSGLNVYNLGNDARFHTGIARVAEKIPGLVILHDTRLHHFAFERSREDKPRFSSYLRLAREVYGPLGQSNSFSAVVADGANIDCFILEMPFADVFADAAIGVLCHSEAASAEMRLRSDTPILTLPLPFASLAQPPKVSRQWGAPWRLVMFGYLHPNRRLESVLDALASWPNAPVFHLDIYGSVWNPPLIETLIAQRGLGSRVTLHGFASEQALDDAIGASHLAFNLRHPTMGEASGGILRSWTQATPTLVTNAGWYAGLPDSIVRKISVHDEIADMHRALSNLVTDPQSFEKMGLCGQTYLRQTHTPELYAQALAQALEQWPRLMVRHASRRLMQRLAGAAPTRGYRRLMDERARMHMPFGASSGR